MKLKKVLAAILAATMIMGMSVTTFAAPSTETATVTVKNVKEEGVTVTAYQLVYYDDETQEYMVVDAAKSQGYTVGEDDADIVAALAKNPGGLASTVLTDTDEDGNYTGELTAGTYLILVTGSGSTIYNPMLVSLEVEYPDGVTDGEVDAGSKYVVNDEEVYAKSTPEVPVTKVITDAEGNIIGEDGKYEDVYSGTRVYFTITGTVPSYSEQYDNDNLTYTLTDEVSSGLTLDEDLQTTLQNQVGDDATVTVDGQTITIDYTNDFIMNHGGQDVVIKYSAVVNGTSVNFNAATNTVNVNYSNSPSMSTEGIPDTTRHYTFDLENAMVKVDNENQETTLTGAEFTLTSEDGKVINGATDKNGNIEFRGLDAGTYTLKETKAPDGYQLSGKEYTVDIAPVYEDDELVSYTVTVKDGNKEIGKMEYTEDDLDGKGSPAKIVNTTLSELPSTGGIGTTIFTVGGCVIMIAAAGLYFASRRRQENK